MNVVVTHWIHPQVSTYLQSFASTVRSPATLGEVWPRARIISEASDAHALVTCMADRVDESLLSACPHLRIVAATLKGYDNYDVAACTAHGVWLTNVPDIIIPPTAELAVALALGIMRNVRQGDEEVRSGSFSSWRPHLYGRSLHGSTVGLVGMGALGRSVANLVRPFGIRRGLYVDSEVRDEVEHWHKVDLSNLLGEADLVIVCLPLNASTYHIINGEALAHLRPGSYIVNIGRGSVVDEAAVLTSLQSGRLAGYAADVFEFEDWALDSRPATISTELRRHPNTLFTPHLGSNPDSIRKAMSMSAAQQVHDVASGRVPGFAVNTIARSE